MACVWLNRLKVTPDELVPLILTAIIVSLLVCYVVYSTLSIPEASLVTLTGTVTSATGSKVPELIASTCVSSGGSFLNRKFRVA